MENKGSNGLFFCLFFICVLISFQECTTPSILVIQEQQKGDHYYNSNQYELAITHYQACLTASAKLGNLRNHDMEADICRKAAHTYSMLGQFDEAIQNVLMALEIDSSRNNQLEIIEDYRMLGNLNLYKGDFKRGIPFLEHALELNKGMESSVKGLNQISVANTYLSIAQANNVLGRFKLAGNFAGHASDLYEKSGDKNGMMEVNLLLGNIYFYLGMNQESLKYLESSIAMAEDLGLSTSRHHLSLGKVYSAMADFEKALRHKMEALEAAKQSRIVPQIVWSCIGVGDAYASLGDDESAKRYFELARTIQDTSRMDALALQASGNIRLGELEQAGQYYNSIDAGVASGLILLRMGEVNYSAGKADSSIRNYRKAIEFFSSSQVLEGIARACLRLGDIYVEKHEFDTARAYLKKAFNLTANDETVWEIWYQKGRIFEQTNRQDSAIAAYKEAVEIIEKIRGRFTIEEYKSKYIDNKVKVYNRLILLLLESDAAGDAFLFAERARARAFLDMIGNRKINIKHTDEQELMTREQDLRLQINALSKMILSSDLSGERRLSRDEVKDELLRSREEYSSLIEQIKLKNKEYASMVSIEPFSSAELKKHLDDQTALMAYWIGDEFMAIWVLTNHHIYSYFTGITQGEVSGLVTDARKAVRKISDFPDRNQISKQILSDNDREDVSEEQTAGERLSLVYNRLIKPVEGFFTGITNIGIIPHGVLHFLPFQALVMPEGQYLIEKYNLFYTPSANVYILCKEKVSSPANNILAMALGDIEVKNFSGLPGTKKEVDQISQIFDNITVRYENESTETYAKKNAPLFRYIHFATHGLLDADQPIYSYLLFAPTDVDDGFLTVNEIFGLDLNAKLITLSACQTGLGDLSQGDEIIGLCRAFIYAGTPAVIVSLWSVADHPTALLMEAFYRNLGTHTPQEALSLAQREVMKEYPAPFYWAPFQLIGRGD